eukprot:5995319-Ditylum_brightwellii.AAC.1
MTKQHAFAGIVSTRETGSSSINQTILPGFNQKPRLRVGYKTVSVKTCWSMCDVPRRTSFCIVVAHAR